MDYLFQIQADLRTDIKLAEARIEVSRNLDERAGYLGSVIEGTAPEPIELIGIINAMAEIQARVQQDSRNRVERTSLLLDQLVAFTNGAS